MIVRQIDRPMPMPSGAVVFENGLDTALLGMSFLNRVEMRRDGDTMTLIRRF